MVGSGSGIGAATVRRLAAEGVRVCAADIDEAGASAVAKEVVGVAALLLSEDGRWINGQVFNVNGGALMR